jgi:hypothetical protein
MPQALSKSLVSMIISLGMCAFDSTAQPGTAASPSETHAPGGADRSTAPQPQTASPDSPPAIQPFASPANVNQKSTNQKQTGRPSKDRLFFTLPNFLTVEDASKAQPLTTRDKFNLTARSSFDYVQYLSYAAVAGVSQAENREPGYGQGVAGYGKRYGAHIADGTIENFTTQAVLPSLLHQDPRYFQLGKGSFWRRSSYAASRIWVTRSDSGQKQVNYSEIFGSGMASAISTYSYYPSTDRNFSNVASLWGSQLAYDTVALVMREFWPDVRRKLRRSNATHSP